MTWYSIRRETCWAAGRGSFRARFPDPFRLLGYDGRRKPKFASASGHPIYRDTFGIYYTQDESYYLLDAEEDATVYLGLKTGVNPDEMIAALNESQQTGKPFDTEKYVNKWPAKRHDHYLIPAGTVHCSGAGAMVLEISATPSIFTFKLWDWGRLGLDGLPRPINIGHGSKVINGSGKRSLSVTT